MKEEDRDDSDGDRDSTEGDHNSDHHHHNDDVPDAAGRSRRGEVARQARDARTRYANFKRTQAEELGRQLETLEQHRERLVAEITAERNSLGTLIREGTERQAREKTATGM